MHSILIRSFVFFSFAVVLAFILVSNFMSIFLDEYMGQSISVYFASEVYKDDYRKIDTSSLERIGGWIMVLDDKNEIEYSTDIRGIKTFDSMDLTDMINGDYQQGDLTYIGTATRFVDEEGKEKIGLVVLPAETIDVKYTIMNSFEGRNEFLTAYLLMVLMFTLFYILLVWSFSRRIKSKLSNPILEINDGIESVMEGDYEISLSLDSINEISNIKNAFNSMAKKLREMQEDVLREQENKLQLYSDLSHDLRTPLTVIQGYTQRLLSGDYSSDINAKYLQSIYLNVMSMAELLDVMKDYTVMNREDFELIKIKEEINEFIRNMIADMFLEFENNNMDIIVKIPEETISCMYDGRTLNRAINNLLNNIISHNGNGTKVYCGLEGKENRVVITVADSGAIIPSEIIDQLFNPFVKGDGSRQNRSHSGLGLSIAKKIIERHNGVIRLEQPYKDYTKAFIIELPYS